jgi:hypothetical protein
MKFMIFALAFAFAAPALAQETQYDAHGPYAVKQVQASAQGCHIFRPIKPSLGPSPVILWGNGTNTMVVRYAPMMVQWSSYGFIVAAAMTGNAGSGQEMLACLDYLEKENTREGSIFKGAVDASRVGASGHSQGGMGAIMAGRDPRVKATAPIQPPTRGARYEHGAETKQHGPMLLLSGGVDNVVDPIANHKPVLDKANVPVFWATLLAAGHNAPVVQDSGPYRPATTAWFLWQLQGDEHAAEMFKGVECGYCMSPAWAVERKGID